jgi:predicted  nucleic acid-binding Zn-ribbon protein
MPECSLCYTNKIDYRNKCLTCKKSICNECATKVFKFYLNKKTCDIIINCPFCREKSVKNMYEINEDVGNEVIHKAFESQYNQNIHLEEQLTESFEHIDVLQNNIAYLEALKEKFLEELKFIKPKKKEKTIKDVIQEFEKKGRKTVRIDELKTYL